MVVVVVGGEGSGMTFSLSAGLCPELTTPKVLLREDGLYCCPSL